MKRQLAVSKVAFLNREGSVWYRMKVHANSTTKFRDMKMCIRDRWHIERRHECVFGKA